MRGRTPTVAYRIETPGLLLRPWSPVDAPLLAEAIEASLEHLRPWMPWTAGEPEPLDRRARRLQRFRARFDAGDDLLYGLFDPGGAMVVGGAGLHRRIGAGAGEIGYWIRAGHTGRGLATQAAAALVRVGVELLGLGRIEIQCDPANAPSTAIPPRLGFTHQVTVAARVALPGAAPRDTMIWALLARDYPAAPVAGFETAAWDAASTRVL